MYELSTEGHHHQFNTNSSPQFGVQWRGDLIHYKQLHVMPHGCGTAWLWNSLGKAAWPRWPRYSVSTVLLWSSKTVLLHPGITAPAPVCRSCWGNALFNGNWECALVRQKRSWLIQRTVPAPTSWLVWFYANEDFKSSGLDPKKHCPDGWNGGALIGWWRCKWGYSCELWLDGESLGPIGKNRS